MDSSFLNFGMDNSDPQRQNTTASNVNLNELWNSINQDSQMQQMQQMPMNPFSNMSGGDMMVGDFLAGAIGVRGCV